MLLTCWTRRPGFICCLLFTFVVIMMLRHPNPALTLANRLETLLDQSRQPGQNKRINIMTSASPVSNEIWTKMNTSKGPLDILVYPLNEDIRISESLLRTGTWEHSEMIGMEQLFACDKELGLIDIGANIGVYVLLSAKWGRPTVGIEASQDSIARLYKSVERNKFQNMVTLVHNAVYNSYTILQLQRAVARPGITVIRSDTNASLRVSTEVLVGKGFKVGDVNTILLDDLIPLVKFKRAVMKVDIEGSEPMAFEQSSKLFSTLDIRYIFMEWKWIQRDRNGGAKRLYTYFTTIGYVPYSEPNYGTPLHGDYLHWPIDVFWLKGTVCQQ